MLVVLARLGSPDLVGQFALGLATTAPVMAFSLLGLRAVQATDARRRVLFADYLALRVLTTIFALVVIAGVAFTSQSRLDAALIILATGLAAAPESISDVVYGFLQNRERMDRIALSAMLRGVLSLGSLAAGVTLTGSVFWSVLAVAAVRCLVLVGYDLPNAGWVVKESSRNGVGIVCREESIRPRWDPTTLLALARLVWPLGITVMLAALIVNIPRYFVEHWWGTHQLGIFAATAYLMFPATTVVDALGQSASPRLAQYYQAGQMRQFRGLLGRFIGIGVLLGFAAVLVATLAGSTLLAWFYGAEFREGAGALTWLMVAAGLNYVASFLGYGITAARYFKIQMLLNGVTATAALFMCGWLVPRYGLRGAAVAIVVAAIVQLVTLALIALHALRAGALASPPQTDAPSNPACQGGVGGPWRRP
jgi:O-antigen/teichoic acid export membrane protein